LHRFCLIHPCDGQTDGQTDGRTELRWLRRAIAVPAVARKKRCDAKNGVYEFYLGRRICGPS